MEKNQVINIFRETNALLEGHFLLTSGKHSNQYFQCAQVLQYPDKTEKLCSVISDYFKDVDIDTIVSPAMGGIIVGQEVARQLGKRSIFAERQDGKLTLRRNFDLADGEKVLVCEDVVTTGGSVKEVIDIVKGKGAELVGVGFIIDRSNGKVKFGVPQVSTLQVEVITYEPGNCPLCKEGSQPYKPGSRK